jgi:serine/threonine protein phosphatase PrpC
MSELIPSTKEYILFSQRSEVGSGPNPNQANAVSFYAMGYAEGDPHDFGVFVVAEGVEQSGIAHAKTARAAERVTNIISAEVLENYYFPLLLLQEPSDLQEVIKAAIKTADKELREWSDNPKSTVILAVTFAKKLYISNLGQSRAYLINQDTINQLSTDNIENGTGGVVHALGNTQRELNPDISIHDLTPSARLLVCSTGLWQHIEPNEIDEVIRRHAAPFAACNDLMEMVQERSDGNVAAILMQFPKA